jgi:8-oxo-dGTP diphosphatase
MEARSREPFLVVDFMKKHIHVVGAAIVHEGKILCAQRPEWQLLPLMWEFPGGKIEPGESPEEALRREIMEEMGCAIEVGGQIEHTVHEYDFGIVHLTTFYCKLLSGTPVLTEHARAEWLAKEELDSLEWAPADLPAVRKIMRDPLPAG